MVVSNGTFKYSASTHATELELIMNQNILVVEAKMGHFRVRYINAYGVQKTAPVEKKVEFLTILDQGIENAKRIIT